MSELNERDSGAKRLSGLIALNGVLLLLLAAVTFSPVADAQSRSRGSYSMVGGRVKGALSGAVWIVDSSNQELIVLTTEPNEKALIGIGYRDLAADAASLNQEGVQR